MISQLLGQFLNGIPAPRAAQPPGTTRGSTCTMKPTPTCPCTSCFGEHFSPKTCPCTWMCFDTAVRAAVLMGKLRHEELLLLRTMWFTHDRAQGFCTPSTAAMPQLCTGRGPMGGDINRSCVDTHWTATAQTGAVAAPGTAPSPGLTHL